MFQIYLVRPVHFIPGLNIANDCHHYEPVVELEYSTSPSYDIGEVGGTIVAD